MRPTAIIRNLPKVIRNTVDMKRPAGLVLAPRGRPALPLRGLTALLRPSFDVIGGESLSWSPGFPSRPLMPPPHSHRASPPQSPPTLSPACTSPSQPCECTHRAPQLQNEPKLTSHPCHTTGQVQPYCTYVLLYTHIYILLSRS
jgi:hypothetical protein